MSFQNKFTLVLLILSAFSRNYAMEKNNIDSNGNLGQYAANECSICGNYEYEFDINEIRFTKCCKKFICQNDVIELEQRAQTLHHNLNDPVWRRQYSAKDDFTGWPVDREHAKCPYCNHYPLISESLVTITSEEKSPHLSCNICLEDKSSNELIYLSCSHSFCINCLKTFIENAIAEKNTLRLTCPDVKCAAPLTEKDIRTVTRNNPEIIKAFSDITTKEWLSKQANAKHCPTVDCPYVFINDAANPQAVTCPSCKQNYCSNCLTPHNRNISCEDAKAERNGDGSFNEWKQNNNARQCPRCQITIEKNGGCQFMNCSRCDHAFCWNCLGAYDHQRHHCVPIRPRINNENAEEQNRIRYRELGQRNGVNNQPRQGPNVEPRQDNQNPEPQQRPVARFRPLVEERRQIERARQVVEITEQNRRERIWAQNRNEFNADPQVHNHHAELLDRDRREHQTLRQIQADELALLELQQNRRELQGLRLRHMGEFMELENYQNRRHADQARIRMEERQRLEQENQRRADDRQRRRNDLLQQMRDIFLAMDLEENREIRLQGLERIREIHILLNEI